MLLNARNSMEENNCYGIKLSSIKLYWHQIEIKCFKSIQPNVVSQRLRINTKIINSVFECHKIQLLGYFNAFQSIVRPIMFRSLMIMPNHFNTGDASNQDVGVEPRPIGQNFSVPTVDSAWRLLSVGFAFRLSHKNAHCRASSPIINHLRHTKQKRELFGSCVTRYWPLIEEFGVWVTWSDCCFCRLGLNARRTISMSVTMREISIIISRISRSSQQEQGTDRLSVIWPPEPDSHPSATIEIMGGC